MKNLKLFTAIGFILACISLAMPFSKFDEYGQTQIFYGHQHVLAYVSVIIFLLIVLCSWAKRSRAISLLGLLLSLSNVFFTVFIMITVTVFRNAHLQSKIEYMNGIWLLLFAATSLLFVAGNDFYHSFKKKIDQF